MAHDHDKFTCGCDKCEEAYDAYYHNRHVEGKKMKNDKAFEEWYAVLLKIVDENHKKDHNKTWHASGEWHKQNINECMPKNCSIRMHEYEKGLQDGRKQTVKRVLQMLYEKDCLASAGYLYKADFIDEIKKAFPEVKDE